MKSFSTFMISMLCSLPSGLAAVVPRQVPSVMHLVAMSYMNAEPSFDKYLDMIGTAAGFNRTVTTGSATYSGFSSYIDATNADGSPIVTGRLFMKPDDGGDDIPAFLVPTTDTANLYDFVFSPDTPTDVSALSTDFAVQAIECGGNCGGLGLVYGDSGTWLAYHDEDSDYGWKLRWFDGDATPEDHYPAILWRS